MMKQTDTQQQRTRKKGEVFSPAWVCNKMNNALDADWFGTLGAEERDVYKRQVYNLFRDFKYNPIDDDRFVPLKESALPLNPEAKEVVDRVLDTFGMYSGKVLESITHKEAPWLDARKGFLPDETSHAEISLDAMKAYFKKVDEKYNIRTEDGLRKYIAKMR